MIQRSLLRQIRASGSLFQKLPISSASRPFSPALRTSALSSRQQRYPQCYSTTAEAKASTEGSTTATEEAPTEAKEEEDPIKKELEAKKAEVIDLKVRTPPPQSSQRLHQPQKPPNPTPFKPVFLTPPLPNRTNTSAPSPTSATSKSAPSAKPPPPKPSPSRASPKT